MREGNEGQKKFEQGKAADFGKGPNNLSHRGGKKR